jgi:hypothetical protein
MPLDEDQKKWPYTHTTFYKNIDLDIDANGVTHHFSQDGNVITITVGADEMLVLKP